LRRNGACIVSRAGCTHAASDRGAGVPAAPETPRGANPIGARAAR